MKAVCVPAVFLFFVSLHQGLAAPSMTGSQFNCQYKPRVDGNWENRGFVDPYTSGDGLHMVFNNNDEGSGMDEIQTTNTDSEYRVEGRCPGSVTLSDNKPFKIRDFTFVVTDAFIGANQGFIELTASGFTFITNTNQKDDFGKVWTVKKTELDRYNNETDMAKKAKMNPFALKQETKTLCSNQLTLRFDDLRGVAMRNQTANVDDRQASTVTIQELWVTFDPC